MYRDIPNTITAIRKALREAKVKYEEVIVLIGTPAYFMSPQNLSILGLCGK